jgi:hypothetical protein
VTIVICYLIQFKLYDQYINNRENEDDATEIVKECTSQREKLLSNIPFFSGIVLVSFDDQCYHHDIIEQINDLRSKGLLKES